MKNNSTIAKMKIAFFSFFLLTFSVNAQTTSTVKIKKESAKEIKENNKTSISATLVEPKKKEQELPKNKVAVTNKSAVVPPKKVKTTKITNATK